MRPGSRFGRRAEREETDNTETGWGFSFDGRGFRPYVVPRHDLSPPGIVEQGQLLRARGGHRLELGSSLWRMLSQQQSRMLQKRGKTECIIFTFWERSSVLFQKEHY